MHYTFTKQPLGALGVVRPRCYAMAYPEGTAEVYVKDMTTGVGSLVWRQCYPTQDEATCEADGRLYTVERALENLGPKASVKPPFSKFLVYVALTEEKLGEVVVRAADEDDAANRVEALYGKGELDTDNFEPNDQRCEVTGVEELGALDERDVDYGLERGLLRPKAS